MQTRSLTESVRAYAPAVAGFGIPFVLIAYLAMKAGGYDLVVRNQVGIIVWWLVLLGVAAGLMPVTRVTRAGWIALGVLGALVLWTGLATLTWTGSAERGMVELSRVASLLGVFALLLLVQGRDGLRRSVSATGAAIGAVAVVALLSRFQPDLVSATEIPGNFPASRLNYPLEYWNGLAALLAMGMTALLWSASMGRSILGRALSAGAVPVLVLAIYLTASRGGAIEAAVAILALVVLFPRRLLLVPTFIVSGAGSAALLALIAERPELRDRELGELASSQGNEMLWLTIGVFALVAAVQALVAFAIQRRKLVIPEVSPGVARATGVTAAVAALAVVVVALGSGFVGDRWSEFKEPTAGNETVSRLGNLNSGERYLVWRSAVDAASSERLTGIGPGTYEFWYAREGDGQQFVRDAHSLYLEALAEIGPIGFLLVLALVSGPILFGGAMALRRGSDERRSLIAAAVAAMAAFAVAAGIDWVWELTVIPVVFAVLVAAVFGPSAQSRRGRRTSRFDSPPTGGGFRVGVGLASLLALAIIFIPLQGTNELRSSQELFRAGDLEGALRKADKAAELQPYSASAHVQQALLLEEMGDSRAALAPAREATREEPNNWRNWLVRSQIATSAGRQREAATSLRKVSRLNPRSSLLSEVAEPQSAATGS